MNIRFARYYLLGVCLIVFGLALSFRYNGWPLRGVQEIAFRWSTEPGRVRSRSIFVRQLSALTKKPETPSGV